MTFRPIPDTSSNQRFKLGYGDYLRFRDLVLERSGLHFPEKKRIDLETGLLKALAESPVAGNDPKLNLDDYFQLLQSKSDPAGQIEMDRLIKTLTIGETHFFRDEAQFNALANRVLPELIRRKRAAAAAVGTGINPQLRIWSAGCSSGEEPYSVAILLKELLPDIDEWHILILATDINQDSLARARQAVYSGWSFREVTAKRWRSDYFIAEPGCGNQTRATRYRLRDDIRRMVTFASLNLTEDNYPAIHNNTVSLDIILCRNVTIYFTEEITRRVIQRFYRALVDGGWLVVGHSEPSLLIYRDFESRSFPDTLLYQKTGRPTAWPEGWEWPDAARANKPGGAPFAPDKQLPAPNGSSRPPISTGVTFRPPQEPTLPASPPLPRQPLSQPAPPAKTPAQAAEDLLNQGRLEEAIAALQQQLAGGPNSAAIYTLLGRAYANQGRWAEARDFCQKAIDLDSLSTEAYYLLASIHQHEGHLGPAIDMFKKVIYLDRQAPLPHFNLAMLYKKMGQTHQARRSYQNAVNILTKWPPEAVVPDSGGAMAHHLITVARRVLEQLEPDRS